METPQNKKVVWLRSREQCKDLAHEEWLNVTKDFCQTGIHDLTPRHAEERFKCAEGILYRYVSKSVSIFYNVKHTQNALH